MEMSPYINEWLNEWCIYIRIIVYHCTPKAHFEIILYFMKLNFYFKELYAVITTCKLVLHDSE